MSLKNEYWNLPYDEQQKYNVAWQIDSYDVWMAAEDMAKELNQGGIRSEMDMSGTVTVAQVAGALAEFLPAFIERKLSDLMSDIETEIANSFYDRRDLKPFHEYLSTAAGLVHAEYHAEPTEDGFVVAVWGEVGRGVYADHVFVTLGVFEEEEDAASMAHAWNKAFAAGEKWTLAIGGTK